MPESIMDAANASLGYTGVQADLENSLLVSPLQMAIAASTISNGGKRPGPHLAITSITTQSEVAPQRTILPALEQASEVVSQPAADQTALMLAHQELPFWQVLSYAPNGLDATVSWYLGGTLPGWQGEPLVIAVVLEEYAPSLVEEIGQTMLQTATQNMLP